MIKNVKQVYNCGEHNKMDKCGSKQKKTNMFKDW